MDEATEFATFDIVALAAEQMLAHGYTKQKNDEDVPDEDAFKQKVYDLVSGRIVSSKAEKSKKSWTQGQLYAAVFPNGPGADKRQNDLLSEEDVAVMDKLSRKVWNLTNPGRAGYVQKRLGQDGGSLILVAGRRCCFVPAGVDPDLHDRQRRSDPPRQSATADRRTWSRRPTPCGSTPT